MAELDINDLATIGQVNDVKPYMLPPEAWTLALNMRYSDGAPEALLGWEQIFGTPNIAPHFIMPISTAATNLWLYASLTKISLYDGSSHADITRAVGGDYNAGETRNWNGTILGGIPIFNNGTDVPQFRADMDAATKFANLTNWPADLRAKIIRAHGPHHGRNTLRQSVTQSQNELEAFAPWSIYKAGENNDLFRPIYPNSKHHKLSMYRDISKILQ